MILPSLSSFAVCTILCSICPSQPLSAFFFRASFLSSFAPLAAAGVSEARVTGGGSAAPACAVSLEAVLHMVQRTAGGVVDADAPLMEAGIDSLGAVELRNLLQLVAGEGMRLPSTLIFDYQTIRQISGHLRGSALAMGLGLARTCPCSFSCSSS